MQVIGLVRPSESSAECRLFIEQHVQVERNQHHSCVRCSRPGPAQLYGEACGTTDLQAVRYRFHRRRHDQEGHTNIYKLREQHYEKPALNMLSETAIVLSELMVLHNLNCVSVIALLGLVQDRSLRNESRQSWRNAVQCHGTSQDSPERLPTGDPVVELACTKLSLFLPFNDVAGYAAMLAAADRMAKRTAPDPMLRFPIDDHEDHCIIDVSKRKRTEPRPTCLNRLRDPSPMGFGSSNTIQRSGENTNGT